MRPNDESQKREARTEGGELGKTLAAAREAQGLTIEEIATELRIEPRLLNALEQCRFEELGPPVFAKGYLKQYGNRLGLKYADLLAEYYRLVEPREVTLAPSRTIKLRDERQITVWIIAALALAVLAAFLMVWLLAEPPAARRPVTALPESEPAAAVGEIGDTQPDAPPAEPAPDEGRSEAEPVAVGEPGALEAEPGNAAPDVAGDAVPTDDVAPPARLPDSELAEAAPTGPTVAIEFAFLEDCWLEATDARGARLFYGLGQAGASRRVTGEPPIDIFLGNRNGVTLTVDGEPYDVPARGRRGNLARFVIDGPTD
jgi:cytoskeleton protein RodZ